MPGVLMVEALFQTSMWLVRVTEDFKHSVVALRKTNNVKFSGFVQPGDQLTLNAKIKSTDNALTKLKVSGSVDGNVTVSGLLTLDAYNLAERGQGQTATDDFMRQKFRRRYRLLCNQLDSNGPINLAEKTNNTFT